MPKKAHLQIRCDEGLRDGLRAAARKDGLLVAQAVRRAILAYVERPVSPVANEAIWVTIATLAANALPPAGIEKFTGTLKAYDDLEQMACRPVSNGIALVAKILSERNQNA